MSSGKRPACAGDDSTTDKCTNNKPRPHFKIQENDRNWSKKFSCLPEQEFRQMFKMSKKTFFDICAELEPFWPSATRDDSVSSHRQEKVAIFICRMANIKCSFSKLAETFNLSGIVCRTYCLEVCRLIVSNLKPKYIKWPDKDGCDRIKTQFQAISRGIPNVVGAIYTTHFSISPPHQQQSKYYNKLLTEREARKELLSYSITLQAVVDPNGIFIDCFSGSPGSLSYAEILQKSELDKRANLPESGWIVGGSWYPLLDWFLKPYGHWDPSESEKLFDQRLCKIEDVVEDAFERLRGRWSFLGNNIIEVDVKDLPDFIEACCVLHNICELSGDQPDPNWRMKVIDDDDITNESRAISERSRRARDEIASNLLHH